MRRMLLAVALVAMGSTATSAQSSKPPCDRRMIVAADSLREMARRLHPESADTAKSRAFVTVGLVFDSECRLVHHAVGRRTEPAFADVVLARLIPEATGLRYVTAGFAELTIPVRRADSRPRADFEPVDLGTPWVVWGVQAAAARR